MWGRPWPMMTSPANDGDRQIATHHVLVTRRTRDEGDPKLQAIRLRYFSSTKIAMPPPTFRVVSRLMPMPPPNEPPRE